MAQPVVGWRKAGLNFMDINVVKHGIAAGKPLVEIQTELLSIDPKAVEACYRVFGPKAAPVFVPDPPPSLDEELGGVRVPKKKG
jgi:hypothetical protein